MVACRARCDAVESVDGKLVPVKVCGIAVIQRQEAAADRNAGRVDYLEVNGVEVRNVARRHSAVYVERIVCRICLAAAVDLSDGGAGCYAVCLCAKIDGVARGRARARRPAAVDVFHPAARDGDNVARGSPRRRGMGKIAAVDVAMACAIVSRIADFSTRDIHFVARCVATLHGGKATVDCAHITRLEVHDIARAVVLCRSARARADRPAAIRVTVVRPIDRERVLRRCVADCGTSRPDVLCQVARTRGCRCALKCIAAKEDLLAGRHTCIRINGDFARSRRGDFLCAPIRRTKDNVALVLHQDALSVRCSASVSKLVPVKVCCIAVDKFQHGVRLIEGAVEVEADHAEIGDVAHPCVRVDV